MNSQNVSDAFFLLPSTVGLRPARLEPRGDRGQHIVGAKCVDPLLPVLPGLRERLEVLRCAEEGEGHHNGEGHLLRAAVSARRLD